jgi:hypothetical protein
MKSIIVKVFLLVHLFFILTGSVLLQFCNLEYPLLERIIDIYSSWTGGGQKYNFFSPEVGYQNAAKAYILTDNDSLIIEAFGGNKNHLDIRISKFIHSAFSIKNAKAFELNARLLSAYIFGIYPNARIVEISLGKVVIPEIKKYLYDPTPSFEEYYRGTYSRVQH